MLASTQTRARIGSVLLAIGVVLVGVLVVLAFIGQGDAPRAAGGPSDHADTTTRPRVEFNWPSDRPFFSGPSVERRSGPGDHK